MVMFTLVFGKLARINSDGVPYAVFCFSALVPWNYFSMGLSSASGSLIGASSMISKVYFPRIILPISALLGPIVEFVVSLIVLFGLMFYFDLRFTAAILYLPLLILIVFLFAGGLGMWLSSIAIQYRDVKHGISFLIRIMMYLSPVIYPYSLVPDRYKLIYAFNPMVGVIEGFRSALLQTRPMPWVEIGIGLLVSVCFLVSGAIFFHKSEKIFADVI